MKESLLSDSRKALAMTAAVFFVLPILIVSTVSALTASYGSGYNSSGINNNYYIQPYTGGAPIAKVLYPADGSTVTITSTGAVIKQGFGRTPYREGWINPADIGNINTPADLRGRLVSGDKNPYISSGVISRPSSNIPSASGNTNTNINNNTIINNSAAQPAVRSSNTASPPPQPQTPPSPSTQSGTSTSSSVNASATANASATLTGSQAPETQTTVQTSASTPASTQTQSSVGKTLPNTGPGDVLALGGITSVLGTIGHLLYQRFRLRANL